MPEYLQAFILGNAAILTNVCILPLYPGLLAYMAANAQNEDSQRAIPYFDNHPELQDTFTRVVSLYNHITKQAIKNEERHLKDKTPPIKL